ncbi:MAG TPA: hypothetical protein VIL85_00840 [Thermomicrobiales bacterium]|jgi:hypothetical protein
MRRSIGVAVACWWLILALGMLGVGVRDTELTPGAVLLCLLFVVAPTALALPAGRALLAPLWALETILSWSLLGVLIALVDPFALGRGLAFCLLLPLVFGVFASPSLLFAAWLAPARATAIRHQGYLLALLPVGLLLLRGLGALGPLTALLFGLPLILAYLLYWSIQRQPQSSIAPAAVGVPVSGTIPTADPASRSVAPQPVSLRSVVALNTRSPLD